MSRRSARRVAGLMAGIVAMFAISSASAIAAGPPIITIGPSSEHTLNTALVSGTVDENGDILGVSYKFEYGKTESYGQSTRSFGVSGSGAIPVSQELVGLESLSTYHVRLSASNSYGTTTSKDLPLEMLLAWKVEGKKLSELSEKAEYLWTLSPEPYPTLTISMPTWLTEITCKPSKNASLWAHSYLGSYYPTAWEGCTAIVNGKEDPGCAPKPFTMNLNSVLEETELTITASSTECFYGPSFAFGRFGFALKAMPEASTQVINMSAKAGKQHQYTLSINNMKWLLSRELVGKKFGIS